MGGLAGAVFGMDMRLLFLLIVSALALQTLYLNSVLLTDALFYHAFGGQLAVEHIDALLRFRREWAWLSYAMVPAIVAIRVGFTAACLLIGAVLVDLGLRFSQAFRVALVADTVFVVAAYAKVAWLTGTGVETVADVTLFTPLSLLAAVGSENVDPWLTYPLQLANAFEAVYWIALAYGLKAVLQRPFSAMLRLVAGSYGLGLLLFAMGVVFVAVNVG